MAGKKPSISAKAILFDIDDTLFPSSEFSAMARKNAVHAMIGAGLDAQEAQARAELERLVKRFGSNFGAHFDLLAEKFECKDKNRVIAAGIAAYHNTKSSISPYPGVRNLLLHLRERGYLLAAASEGMAIKQWDKLIRLGIDHLFHKVFVTSASGEGKNAQFYKNIAKSLKIAPEHILMVGDNPHKDISPARQAGMKTARVFTGKHSGEKSHSDILLKTVSELGQVESILGDEEMGSMPMPAGGKSGAMLMRRMKNLVSLLPDGEGENLPPGFLQYIWLSAQEGKAFGKKRDELRKLIKKMWEDYNSAR